MSKDLNGPSHENQCTLLLLAASRHSCGHAESGTYQSFNYRIIAAVHIDSILLLLSPATMSSLPGHSYECIDCTVTLTFFRKLWKREPSSMPISFGIWVNGSALVWLLTKSIFLWPHHNVCHSDFTSSEHLIGQWKQQSTWAPNVHPNSGLCFPDKTIASRQVIIQTACHFHHVTSMHIVDRFCLQSLDRLHHLKTSGGFA